MIVRQIGPRLAVRAVVLPYRSPLSFAHIRTPEIPVAGLSQSVLQLAETTALAPTRHPSHIHLPGNGAVVKKQMVNKANGE